MATTASATIVVRRRAPLSETTDAPRPLTSAELGERSGASPDDLAAVRTAAAAAGLTVVAEHGPSRRVRVAGPAETIRAWVARTPDELRDVATAILGGESPQAFPRSAVARPHAAGVSYTPLQLAEIYAMPQADGTGQTIAIIELGGGFGQDDLDTYFSGLGLATPNVRAVGVDGGTNRPGQDPDGADGEVLLDIEVAGAIAPKADLLVYFAPNTDAGFLDAITTAAHADPAPTAISISWGQSEDQWTPQARTAMDDAFADAVAMGVTVTAAAGDNGSGDRDTSAGAHADFPASSPHVLGCGGTSLQASDGTVISEVVWNDGGSGGATGGGVSDAFAVPDWQQAAGVPSRSGGGSGRGVPDVAAVADPQTGYRVLVDGRQQVIGGTSAVAPLWAGLIARIVQLSGKPIGLAQTALYAGVSAGAAAPHVRDITDGDNGAYRAAPGWDPCTGLGVPSADTVRAFADAGTGTGTGSGAGRAFEYAQLSLDRDPHRRDGDDFALTAHWHEGDATTAVASSADGAVNPVVLLDRYGAQGWELVGPPEVEPYVPTGAGADGTELPAGEWLVRRFWLRRATASPSWRSEREASRIDSQDLAAESESSDWDSTADDGVA